jgi:hypothetical protein
MNNDDDELDIGIVGGLEGPLPAEGGPAVPGMALQRPQRPL